MEGGWREVGGGGWKERGRREGGRREGGGLMQKTAEEGYGSEKREGRAGGRGGVEGVRQK